MRKFPKLPFLFLQPFSSFLHPLPSFVLLLAAEPLPVNVFSLAEEWDKITNINKFSQQHTLVSPGLFHLSSEQFYHNKLSNNTTANVYLYINISMHNQRIL